MKPRAAIIGAGAAGLCLARQLIASNHPVVIYEATNTLGGTWAYSTDPSPSTSLYASLRCNLPKQIMCYSDRPFPADTPSFVHHPSVLQYLQQYAADHNLRKHIVFNARVAAIKKLKDVWLVRVNGETQAFGLVAIAVGQYTVPNAWAPPGAETFCQEGRTISHSQVYKTPTRYKGRRVVVVGAGASGIDIAIELSRAGANVTVSHSSWRANALQGRLREVGRLRRLTASGIAECVDGATVRVDDVVLCTGFQYRYPFLAAGEAGVRVSDDGRFVSGMVGHLYARDDPTLAIMGMVWKVIPFPLMEDQAAFLAVLWGGRVSQRRLKQFEAAERKDWDAGLEGELRFLHRLADRQWEYRRRLADVSGRPMPQSSFMEVMQDASAAQKRDFWTYREREYVIFGSGSGEWAVYVDGVDATGVEKRAQQMS